MSLPNSQTFEIKTGDTRSTVPTIGKIADLVGVSKSTVSLALRNSPKIQKETCKRIQAIARQMNYRPNPLVAAQMSHIRSSNNNRRSTPTIGFLNTWRTNRNHKSADKIKRCIRGAKERAEQLGFIFELLEFDRDQYSDQRIQNVLSSRGVEGLVVAPCLRPEDMPILNWSEFALAAIGCFEAFHHVHRIFHDSFTGVQQVLHILRNRNYKRIGFITNTVAERDTGYLFSGGFLEYQARLISDHEQVPILNTGERGKARPEEMLKTLGRWLADYQPDAVIGIQDQPLSALRELGYRIPEDIGYVALNWDNSMQECAGYTQSMSKVGAAAIESLANRLYQNERGLPVQATTTLLLGEFVEGSTLLPSSLSSAGKEAVQRSFLKVAI